MCMRGERIDLRSDELSLELSERSTLCTSCFTAGKIPPVLRSEDSATSVDM
jgi:hypothetical protein